MKSCTTLAFAVGFALLIGAASEKKLQPDPYVARVIKVIDGDTVLLCKDTETPACLEQQSIEVNLWGIDAPELIPFQQKYGDTAAEFLKTQIEKSVVVVEERSLDQDNSINVEIFVPNRTPASLNLSMLFEGLAWVDLSLEGKEESLEKAQNFARVNRLGLWIAHEPDPPWVFREEVAEFTE